MSSPGLGTVTRRAAIGALAAAGVGFAVFGPRGAKERPGGRLVLDYWEKWTGHEGRAMQRVVDDFNRSQDRIFVRYLATSGIDQKAMVAIAGGDPPDIVGLWNFNVPGYAESNALIPLDDLAPRFGVRRENYAGGIRPLMSHRGRLWAVVNTAGTVALYYNRSLFREAGLDPDRAPRTIEELDTCDKALTRAGRGGQLERAGFLHTEPGWWSWIWGYSFGGRLYDQDSERSLVDSPQNVGAYEWVQSCTKRLGVEPLKRFMSTFGNYDSPLNPFLAGKVAMAVQGPWLANVVNAFKPDLDYGVTPFPVAADLYDPAAPVGLIDTDVLMIPRGAPHPEASMEFIAHTQRQDVVEFLATAHCKISPLATASEEFLSHHPNRGIRVHTAIASSPRSFLCPTTRTWLQFKEEFDAAAENIWTLHSPAATELSRLQARTQALLDGAADHRRRRAALAEGRA
jgi:ABC-type glycerol-3-phosphate transport system substrate-binding protein